MVNIAILGYGTVGSGVFEVIKKNQDLINKRSAKQINIKYVLDLREFPGDPVEEVLVHDYNVILNDPDVQIVVEVMGGLKPAYDFVKSALLKGKSVCTSNKELVAKYGPELLEIAREGNINFLFEASAGGAIPVIRPLISSITSDCVNEITGILNGTTNYILTQMADKGWNFDAALAKAQEYGYAERNPEADIEGYDACRKIAILSSLAFGNHVDFEDIYTEGISKITAEDISYAKALGRSIKLLASSKYEEGKYYAMVAPFMVAKNHPLYSVNDVFNAIFVNGDNMGDIMFYGSGAGKLTTASAVVSDVVDATKHLHTNIFTFWDSEKLNLTGKENAVRAFFVRVSGKSEEKLSEIEKIFGKVKVVQLNDLDSEFGFVTEQMTEKQFEDSYIKIDGAISRIRLEK